MKSKWYKLKNKVIKIRQQGVSMSVIEHKYGITRSTLSSWFKKVKLTATQKKKLLKNSNDALAIARRKAVLWHNKQKQKRIKEAQQQALQTLKNINIKNKYTLELVLAILYLGEGGKTISETNIGSSNQLILKFFLSCLKKIYNFDIKKIKCELHLRADQNSEKTKRFWAKELKLPLKNFKQITVDKRTLGSKTFPYYKGVCTLRCGNVAIKRRLLFLADFFCKKIIKKSGL